MRLGRSSVSLGFSASGLYLGCWGSRVLGFIKVWECCLGLHLAPFWGSCVKSDALFRGSLGSTGCGFSLKFQECFQAHRTECWPCCCSCQFVAVAVLVDVALMVPRIQVPRVV